MAKKSNIRSMRFSDRMIEIIEAQAGETFTAKFEALVTRCMWELPAKEQELQGIQKRIQAEQQRLRKIQKAATNLERTISNMNIYFQETNRQIKQASARLDDILKET